MKIVGGMDRPTWHECRRRGVGGSDVAKIMGAMPPPLTGRDGKRYFEDCTPTDAWKMKLGRAKPKPLEPGDARTRGTRLEGHVLRRTAEIMGLEVADGLEFVKHPAWPQVMFQANTDGEARWRLRDGRAGPPGLVEAKTVKNGSSMARLIQRGELPLPYAMQTQMYMRACDYRWGLLGAFVGPPEHNDWTPGDVQDFVVISYRPAPQAVELMETAIQDFWLCVEEKIPPGTLLAREAVSRSNPDGRVWVKGRHYLLGAVTKALGKEEIKSKFAVPLGWPSLEPSTASLF